MSGIKSILSKSQTIDDKYAVAFFLKKRRYTETYRILNEVKATKFLKLFDYNKLHRTQFTNSGDILEIEILKQIKHPNIVKYNDNGDVIIDNQKFAYVVLDFVSGETLADKMKRENNLNLHEAKDVILGILNGLSYLHNKQIIHNDITSQNIMLDLSGKVPIPKIIDFSYACFLQQSHKDFFKDDLYPFYTANETFNKIFSFQSDIYSVGALFYNLLMGLPPHFIEISKYKSNKIALEEAILEERKKSLKFSDKTNEQIRNIILKALHPNTEHRFKSTKEFIQALNGELEVGCPFSYEKANKVQLREKKKGEGFAAIAGMQKLKETIQLDVIDALNNKERYAEYGLTIPNGILLYGPPGCGKTFFAEKMAEEIGFNFYQIKPSDIQSKFVNASQENIKNLFDEARRNSPSIIFIDELDALVPSRDTSNISHMNTSAVNEFLAQMNNCGDDNVFIIGATNRPNSIDPAILRSGRLDKHVYIPPPDFQAREMMFKLYLGKRPVELGIDYIALANATENYVSSDIKFLCDEASRDSLKLNSRITMKILLCTIRLNKPSVSIEELNNYKIAINKQINTQNGRPKIGFKNK